mmetsp:Transcript_38848/g.112224  ORF Transcript_38848/g.112224 Transcript_38848/m.112224 type:complete len:95 (-) Transcript_38848:17-301(-)
MAARQRAAAPIGSHPATPVRPDSVISNEEEAIVTLSCGARGAGDLAALGARKDSGPAKAAHAARRTRTDALRVDATIGNEVTEKEGGGKILLVA